MNQDADNWDVLQSLFHFAEEHPETDLDALLAQACTDPELRARAKTLILLARESSDDTRTDDTRTDAWSQRSQPPGRRIGPYAIVRLLGSGGIGTVYLVERLVGGVVQRAALKVLSLHAAGPAFTDRFAREQHILASLEHPHITRMLDAGLSDAGEPYLVMEYVDGVHLDTFCDDRSLDVAARLKLFLEVCDAVAYAHRNLVVHLDLKPSNILVSAKEDNVKLLDFGTSKLIQPDSLLTTTVMATPAYASPEQLRNEAVTTACDVYALGAILFELLSGRRPNQDSSVALMIERSLKELPPEPITGAVTPEAAAHRGLTQTRLLNVLRGDLATIVAKCLSPRPKDRYASVDALITDVQRYLAGRPILARPQTTTYRLTKFVRRNRKAVVAGVLAVIALAGISGYALWRQHQAVVAGERAMQMQNFMYRLFKLANSSYMGKPAATVPEFLQLGVKVLPEFINDPADQRAADLSLAESMFDNGDLSHSQDVFLKVIDMARAAGDVNAEAEAEAFAGNNAYNLGHTEQGNALTAHALELSRHAGVAASTRVWAEEYYASNRENSGFRSDDNVKLLQDAVNESKKQHLPVRETAFALYMLASDYEERGRLDEAEQLIRQSIAIYSTEPYATCDQSQMFADLGFIQGSRGDDAGSLPLYQKAYEGLRMCSGAGNHATLLVESYLAGSMIKVGKARDAIPMLEASMPAWRSLVGSSQELANPLVYLARAYLAAGEYSKAEPVARELVAIQNGKVGAKSMRWAASEFVLAQALAGERRYREALAPAETADGIYASEASTPGQKVAQQACHQLLLDIQSKADTAGR